MPFRADLELARTHLGQVEKSIEQQRERIASLKSNGQPAESAENLMKVLSDTKLLILDFTKRPTAAE